MKVGTLIQHIAGQGLCDRGSGADLSDLFELVEITHKRFGHKVATSSSGDKKSPSFQKESK